MRSFLFVFFPFFGFLIFCTSFPIEISPSLNPNDDSSLVAALGRVKKDAESISYLEECAFVESWQEQPGFINVLSFLDASWEYSHRQATMLQMLQSRLEKSGITGIRFFVINSAKPEAAVNIADIEDERKAWSAADRNIFSYHDSTIIEKTRKALKEKIGPDIVFLQDNDELKIWDKLSASRDQVLVIDKCGRLSYRVIVPWSILHFPYVKAAILSTYKEQPCGVCDHETTTLANELQTETEELEELRPEDWNLEKIEEIVVTKFNLDQTDNVAKKIYHETESQEIPENVIKLLNESAMIKQKDNTDFNNMPKFEALVANNDSDFDNTLYPSTTIPTENNTDDYENNTLDYNDGTEILINYETTEGMESKTANSIENESTYNTDTSEYSQETTEPNHTSITKSSEQSESIETQSLYSTEVSEFDNRFNNNSDSEDWWNTSSSITEEQTENQIKVSIEDNSESDDYVLPIRIIMHAPHIHEFEGPSNKHEYLVLKLGKPEYHGHLDYDDDFVSIDSVEKKYSNVTDPYRSEEIERTESGSGEIYHEEIRKKQHSHHKSSKHVNIIYEKDESPGFYGEDSEYWRNFGNVEDDQRIQIGDPSKVSNNKENTLVMSELKPTQYTIIEEDITMVEYPTTEIHSTNQGKTETEVQKIDIEEEEIADHLIEHYSKLIPWLDYVID